VSGAVYFEFGGVARKKRKLPPFGSASLVACHLSTSSLYWRALKRSFTKSKAQDLLFCGRQEWSQHRSHEGCNTVGKRASQGQQALRLCSPAQSLLPEHPNQKEKEEKENGSVIISKGYLCPKGLARMGQVRAEP
jgi:hypothetical protein